LFQGGDPVHSQLGYVAYKQGSGRDLLKAIGTQCIKAEGFVIPHLTGNRAYAPFEQFARTKQQKRFSELSVLRMDQQ
jgi:hypothetical protein